MIVASNPWSSRAEDLGKFAIALMSEKLVGRAALEKMWTPNTTGGGEETGCGFAVALMTNLEGAPRYPLAGAIADICLE